MAEYIKVLPDNTVVKDFADHPIVLGDCIRNLESGWIGRITKFEKHGNDIMLMCYHEMRGIPEQDDRQWHSPKDVLRIVRKLEDGELWNALRHYPDAWIETTEAMNDEQLGCVPPAAGMNGLFLVGEPARHDESGVAYFTCFRFDKGRYRAKQLTLKEFHAL